MVGGDYVTPLLVGGKQTMIGNLIAPQFGAQFNWPLGAAMSLVMLIAAVVIIYALPPAGRVWAARTRAPTFCGLIIAISFIVFLLSPIAAARDLLLHIAGLTNFPYRRLVALQVVAGDGVIRQFRPCLANSLIIGVCVAILLGRRRNLAAMGAGRDAKQRASVITAAADPAGDAAAAGAGVALLSFCRHHRATQLGLLTGDPQPRAVRAALRGSSSLRAHGQFRSRAW